MNCAVPLPEQDENPGIPAGIKPKNLYGRRHGRPLRKRKAGLIETLLPKLRIELPSAPQKLDVGRLFSRPASDLWVEIGFGGGEHLAAQAAAHPEIGFIGAEFFINGVASLLNHLDTQGTDNVRVVPGDARPLLDALPDASVGRCFLLFPDPWPKKRHASRRFIGPENLDRLARILKDGAELRMATDDPTLLPWMHEHTWRHPAFEWLAQGAKDWRVPPPDWLPTRYEQKAVEAGRTPHYLRFARKAR